MCKRVKESDLDSERERECVLYLFYLRNEDGIDSFEFKMILKLSVLVKC